MDNVCVCVRIFREVRKSVTVAGCGERLCSGKGRFIYITNKTASSIVVRSEWDQTVARVRK